jgi:hypothetical protein
MTVDEYIPPFRIGLRIDPAGRQAEGGFFYFKIKVNDPSHSAGSR